MKCRAILSNLLSKTPMLKLPIQRAPIKGYESIGIKLEKADSGARRVGYGAPRTGAAVMIWHALRVDWIGWNHLCQLRARVGG